MSLISLLCKSFFHGCFSFLVSLPTLTLNVLRKSNTQKLDTITIVWLKQIIEQFSWIDYVSVGLSNRT